MHYRSIALIALILSCCHVYAAEAAKPVVALFADGKPRCYLDLAEEQADELGIAAAATDFLTYFERMTGSPLSRSGGLTARFMPSGASVLHCEMTVARLADGSKQSSSNADVGMVLSPTSTFTGGPLAGEGEKVAWMAGWDRGAGPGTLTFRLIVANKPYYGPGYGPFTFVEIPVPAPRFEAGETMQMALEMRTEPVAAVRGGFRVGDEWRWTEWFEPGKAGTDSREPGKSDQNGSQAWAPDWPAQWAKTGATLHVYGYGAKDRQAEIALDDVKVTRGQETLFADGFDTAAPPDAAVPAWSRYPRQGPSLVTGGQSVFRPDPAAWNSVGLRAQSGATAHLAGLLPIKLDLQPYPPDRSRFDASTVQGFEIVTDASAVTLRASTPLGLENALYYLLERWGCRWVMPGPVGECIPKHALLGLSPGTIRFWPRNDFAVEPTGAGGEQGQWYRRNLCGFQNWLSAQHYWLYALPPEKYFADHPEWYSLIGGKRLARQLCTSNPEVIAKMIEVAKGYLAGGKERLSFPMDPMDCIDFCQCDKCTALDPPGPGRDGVPSATDRVLAFANAVADGIKADFPDRYVAFYAYWSHGALPKREKPRSNVVVMVCRDNQCLLHLTPTRACPTSDYHSLVRGWQALTPRLYCYEYDPVSWTGGLPCPTYLQMARSLKTLFGELGVVGSYSDGGFMKPESNPGTFLNMYLARRMKVDPTQDPERLLTDTCAAFFGPAGAPMERYYRKLAEVAQHGHPGRGRLSVGTTFYHEIFTPQIVSSARKQLDEALRLTQGQAPYDERLRLIEASQRYLESYLDGVWCAQKGQYEASVAAFDRMDGVIAELVALGRLPEADTAGRARTMRLKTLAAHFPERLGFVTKWRLLGPFDNGDRNADLVSDAFEADALAGRGSANAEWFDYASPTGFVNLEEALAERKGNWPVSYCYAATTVESKVNAPARLLLDSFFPFKVYLNGAEVFHRPGLDADCPDKRVVDVELKQGNNLVVVKLSQTQITSDVFPWGLYFRVDQTDQRPEAAALPALWAFKADPADEGVQQQWFAPMLKDEEWLRIPVGKPWEQTDAGAYDGYGWYRAKFALPAADKPLALVFGAVDEQAWVYLNGQLIGEHTVKSTGKSADELWEEQFEIKVPAAALRAGENVLAVRVHDSAFAGGLYRRVRLVVDQ